MELTKIGETKITQQQNFTSKQMTLAPPKGRTMSRNQIKKFCEDLEKKLPKGSTMLVRAVNILNDTTLYSTYGKPWDTDEQWADYLAGMAEESDKFKEFYNFTVSVTIDK